MVRINIIEPWRLTDQHLVAEYLEILMLVSHARRYPMPRKKPPSYCLGPGHICFFKDKLLYLKRRHEELKKEMRRRGFRPKKSVSLRGFSKSALDDWEPRTEDVKIIKRRIIERIRQKPDFYRYYGERRSLKFLIGLIKKQ